MVRAPGTEGHGSQHSHVLLNMRLAVLLLVLATLPAAGQSVKETLIRSAKGLPQAKTEAARDSLSTSIAQALSAILGATDGLTVPMDDVPLSRVEPPDASFRLVTWNIPRDDGSQRYEGLLAVPKGRGVSVVRLKDMTPGIAAPEAVELGAERWYGALYYAVVPVKKGGRTYYTLLGWKGYNKAETRKVIEVLSFRNGKPRFGAPLFGTSKPRTFRKVYGYAFQATMVLRWDPEMEAILMDHLSPSRPDMAGQPAFYGPDMTHDAYFWYKGQWWLEPDIDARDRRPNARSYKPPPRPPAP